MYHYFKTNPVFKFQMAQLSSDDIGHVEELANSNRELSKNDFIFHIKVLPIPFLFRHILNLDGLTSKCFNKFFFRIPTCLSSLIVSTQSVTTIGMRRFIFFTLLLIMSRYLNKYLNKYPNILGWEGLFSSHFIFCPDISTWVLWKLRLQLFCFFSLILNLLTSI